MSVVLELPGILTAFSDGSVRRFSPEMAAASPEFTAGYKSKDVVIDPSTPITARIFVPGGGIPGEPLPVLLYFHGGGFCIGSTRWVGYNDFLGGLCAAAVTLIISVDYRLAPEHRLPAAYDDCFSVIRWLGGADSAAASEPWLKHADISRVFLSGDSAGANICHHVALRSLREGTGGATIQGLMSIHPYFGSERRSESESRDGAAECMRTLEAMWRLSLPVGSDRDHYACNVEKAELAADKWAAYPATAVYVAGMDVLRERAEMYAEFLRGKGVAAVELVTAEGEQHAFHFFSPFSAATRRLQAHMAAFIARLPPKP